MFEHIVHFDLGPKAMPLDFKERLKKFCKDLGGMGIKTTVSEPWDMDELDDIALDVFASALDGALGSGKLTGLKGMLIYLVRAARGLPLSSKLQPEDLLGDPIQTKVAVEDGKMVVTIEDNTWELSLKRRK